MLHLVNDKCVVILSIYWKWQKKTKLWRLHKNLYWEISFEEKKKKYAMGKLACSIFNDKSVVVLEKSHDKEEIKPQVWFYFFAAFLLFFFFYKWLSGDLIGLTIINILTDMSLPPNSFRLFFYIFGTMHKRTNIFSCKDFFVIV